MVLSRPLLRQLRRPAFSAALLAAIYLCGGLLYIQLSGKIAAGLAQSEHDLERLERSKGIVFISVTGLFLFAAAWLVLRHLEGERRRLTELEWALVREAARSLPAVLATSISHEVKNLLHVAILQAEALAATRASDLAVASARELESSLRRLADAGDRIRELAAPLEATAEPAQFHLRTLLDDICELATVHTQMRIRGLDRRIATHARLEGNSALLGLAVFDLLFNAAALGRAAAVRLEASDQPGEVQIEIHDDGPIQTEELRERLRVPAFGRRGDGADFGLLSVRAAVESFGGQVEIGVSPLGGNCVRLSLPALPVLPLTH